MELYPLSFHPVLKRTIWGGRRLGDQLAKPIGAHDDYAESWEIVDHGDDQSRVATGELAGRTLTDLISQDRQAVLGDHGSVGAFPLLLKYLDCNRVLSVQVHPGDAYGLQMPDPDLGKTEAWYIVAAEPGSLVYAGLKSGVDRPQLEAAIAAGETEATLHAFEPQAGDILFIPAGTVHALGAGLLVAEIQQSSDTTFRLFDWNRVDAAGRSRPLHLQQALEVTDYDSGPVIARRSDRSTAGFQTVVQCEKFVLDVLERGSAPIGGDGQFHIITVPSGSAALRWQEQTIALPTGSSLLLPAAISDCEVEISGSGTLLAARLPD